MSLLFAEEPDLGPTPDTSPPDKRDEDGFDFEGERFLKANFDSLSVEQMHELFDSTPSGLLEVPNPRLSISARFLSKTRP